MLHRIVESEAYSDEEFKEAVNKLGKYWYIFMAKYFVLMLNDCFSIEQKDENGRTPIMIAAMLNKHKNGNSC